LIEDAGFTRRNVCAPARKFPLKCRLKRRIISSSVFVIGATLTNVNVKAVSNAVPYATPRIQDEKGENRWDGGQAQQHGAQPVQAGRQQGAESNFSIQSPCAMHVSGYDISRAGQLGRPRRSEPV